MTAQWLCECGAQPLLHVLWDAETMRAGLVCADHMEELAGEGGTRPFAAYHVVGDACGPADACWQRFLSQTPRVAEFAQFARTYLEAAGRRDAAMVSSLATVLNSSVSEAVAARDTNALGALGSRISRLRRQLSTTSPDEAARAPLSVMLNTIEVAQAVALAERSSEHDAAEARTLCDPVFATVAAGTGRPTAIAAALDVDVVQVSRALRLLCQEGRLEPTAPPEDLADDSRIRWYRVADTPQALETSR
jgi:hypothetical protein